MEFGGLVDVVQDAPDVLMVGPPAPVETYSAMAADEQRGTEMAFQHADAVGDGWRGDAEFGGGKCEVLEAGGDFEERQAVERRQRNRGTRTCWVHIE